ncbi:uncharacterized protein [Haliotis asinina]|uniref:uncharacterized protein n=1 Tax=Haliotis asinina TaxID=109174 RepID=UPI003531A102
MPTFHSKKDSLYRARKKTFSGLPSHRRDLVIPDTYQMTDSGHRFLIIDDGNENKILGFSTDENLEHPCAAETIYGDGTFYVTPTVFYQLYTLHAMIDNQMFPLVFLLLPDKRQVTYERAFQLVKDAAAQRGFQLLPNQIQMDFEVASKNAVMSVFPGSTWKGCFFHFTQCVWRKAQQFGLQIDYVWLQTLADMPQDRRCEQLADYVTTQWIEGDQAPPVWNHHDTEGPRTNNHLEGWHGRLKKMIAKAHPNIFELNRFLIGEQKKRMRSCWSSMPLVNAPLQRRRNTRTSRDDSAT